jgi:hypothetical protein
MKVIPSQGKYAIYCYSKYLCTFGMGKDIMVDDNCSIEWTSTCFLGYTYYPPPGVEKQS